MRFLLPIFFTNVFSEFGFTDGFLVYKMRFLLVFIILYFIDFLVGIVNHETYYFKHRLTFFNLKTQHILVVITDNNR